MKLRMEAAAKLNYGLATIPQIKIPQPFQNSGHFYQMYTIMLPTQEIRDALQEDLASQGIMSKVYYQPVHLKTLYRKKYDYAENDLPRTEEISRRILTLPIYPGMSNEEIESIVKVITEFFQKRMV